MIANRIRKSATPNIVSRTTAETTGAEVVPLMFRAIVLTPPGVADASSDQFTSCPWYVTRAV